MISGTFGSSAQHPSGCYWLILLPISILYLATLGLGVELEAYIRHAIGPLYESTSSSIKPELHNVLHTIIHKSEPNSLITLTFRSHHETFIRRSWYSVIPDLDVMNHCLIKKTVVDSVDTYVIVRNCCTNQMNLFLEKKYITCCCTLVDESSQAHRQHTTKI